VALNHLAGRLERIFRDGRVDEEERLELSEVLATIVGGTAGVILGEDASTELPFDIPPPEFVWRDSVFVFTGKFAYGTRSECQRHVVTLGAICDSDVTRRTDCLVIGTFGSRDWVHTSFGRKIEKAVSLRGSGANLFIAAEDHWAQCLERAV
jgi:NAD-dependent DNA ligase